MHHHTYCTSAYARVSASTSHTSPPQRSQRYSPTLRTRGTLAAAPLYVCRAASPNQARPKRACSAAAVTAAAAETMAEAGRRPARNGAESAAWLRYRQRRKRLSRVRDARNPQYLRVPPIVDHQCLVRAATPALGARASDTRQGAMRAPRRMAEAAADAFAALMMTTTRTTTTPRLARNWGSNSRSRLHCPPLEQNAKRRSQYCAQLPSQSFPLIRSVGRRQRAMMMMRAAATRKSTKLMQQWQRRFHRARPEADE